MSTVEASKKWGVTPRRVTKLCSEGIIEGAFKNEGRWELPSDAKKPIDGRTFKASGSGKPILPLPIGISDYRLASSEYFYIDKTMMIKDFLDERPTVSLFTRPRRFGKTLNMDMLRTFFEKTKQDTSIYFKDKKIWSCGEKYRQYQGKYPVIFLSFKDVKCDTWEETLENLTNLFCLEASRHRELVEDNNLSSYEKSFLSKLISGKISSVELSMALANLSMMLHEHYQVKPIIIIDEYDTPIQQGHVKGFYDEVISFMRNLFSGGFKDNPHLSFGFLTGILKVAEGSIFSGLNNLAVNSIMDGKYSQYFGFTKDEVLGMAEYYHVEDKYDEICSWYDGYLFGNTEIFNPWSVVNYFRNNCEPLAYWQSTGSNEIIQEVLSESDEDIYEKMARLLEGKSIRTYIDTSVIYPQIKNNPSSIFSFLLIAGYLKVVSKQPSFTGDYLCEVALPNKEIAFVYNKEILEKFQPMIPQSTAISIQEALYSKDMEALQKNLEKLLSESVSYYDTNKENFYQGLMLGLCATLDNRFQLTSNRESGDGRYDISLCPKQKEMPGILIELKAKNHLNDEQLNKLANEAIQQIKDKQYETELLSKGITKVIRIGVAFSDKKAKVVSE